MLWDLDVQSINALFGAALNANRASIGLPLVDNVRDYAIGDQPWLATDPILDPWLATPDLDVVQTGAWILPDVTRSGPSWWRSWTLANHPCTPAAAACPCAHRRTSSRWPSRRSERRAAAHSSATAGPDLALVDDRDDCFVVGEINQQALFGRVAAVGHHGGAGTTTTATEAGAPQVVAAQAADQPYWAARVDDPDP